jgi:hypothetical protein
MDPCIESQKLWSDFHGDYLIALRAALVPLVRPKYEVRAERFVYLCDEGHERQKAIAPDVPIADAGHGWREYAGTAVATAVQPVDRTMIVEEPIEQTYLTVRDIEDRHVVTVIELLSPTNKDGADGLHEYRLKRANICHSDAHLVKLDLLRGGERLKTTEPLPPGDFYAFSTRKWQSPKAVVYPWTLRDRLPTIPIPLKDGDPDVPLELQPIFDGVYERAGYDYSLKYDRPITPPLSEADQAWAAEILASRQPPAWMTKQEATP